MSSLVLSRTLTGIYIILWDLALRRQAYFGPLQSYFTSYILSPVHIPHTTIPITVSFYSGYKSTLRLRTSTPRRSIYANPQVSNILTPKADTLWVFGLRDTVYL